LSVTANALGATASGDTTVSGGEFQLGGGVFVRAGPIGIVPKVSFGIGSFSSESYTIGPNTGSCDIGSGTSGSPCANSQTATHTFIFLGVGGFYMLDFGKD
jgi:hypothetical protein